MTLSGDAAIYEYGAGGVYDEAHDLSLLRSVILGGDVERLRGALTENVVYYSEYSDYTYTGVDAVLEQLRTVQKEVGVQYFVHYAVISSAEESGAPLPYGEGKQCLVLATEQPEQAGLSSERKNFENKTKRRLKREKQR